MKKTSVLIFIITLLLLNSFTLFNNFSNYNLSSCYARASNQIEKQMITMEEAKKIAERRFEKYGIKSIEYTGKQAGEFNNYQFDVTLESGKEFCVRVSAKDGNLIKIDCFDDQMLVPINQQKCLELVEEHIQNMGFKDLEVIWSTKLGDDTVINLAPVEENVVVYPDLIKARVNCKTGKIEDLEARAYLNEFYPKLEAELLIPTIPYEDAKQKLRDDFIVLGYRLALIFDSEGIERLVYELRSQYKEFLYLVYIDAKTGEQVMAMPVVE